ncbi:MAG TPA: FabA/FabZ family ACP-dehydratase [Candidatus Methylacidiphilales bacterium]|nr:FabA/FabZ family ACP-dehydratase [Candidatus Methylacidiphilales bacterium]
MSSLTPHGQGFSFLDTFVLTDDPKRGRGTKWLDPKLPFFADHFPGEPLMPAVLLIECAAQTAGALWASLREMQTPSRFVLAQVLQFKILHAVPPGENVETEAAFTASLGALAQFEVVLAVNQREVARGKIVLGDAASV